MERPTALAAVLTAALLVVPAAAAPVMPAAETSVRPAARAPVAVGGSDPAGAAAAGVVPPSPSDNTTARLVLPRYRVEQSHFETVRIGMSSVLQVGADDARAEHFRTTIRREFDAAESVAERRSVVDRALIDLSARADDLEARERDTIRDYSNGNITTETMVRRLARIDAQAGEIDRTLDLVRQFTDRIGTRDFDSRIRDVHGVVETLRGPVRQRVARALSGEEPSVRIYIVASDRGLVLSMLDEGQYVREATRWSNRNRSAPSQLDTTGIGRRFEELYPWVTSQQAGTSIEWQGAGAWKLEATHSQGELSASVDASTAEVYREVQWLSVVDMPSTMTVVRVDSGVRVSVMRTYPGGPLRLLIEDAATDAVINARVTVDDHELGRIGADGVVVTLEPYPPYTVNVTGNGTSVSFRMDEPFNATDS